MKFTIITICKNAKDLLQRTIESVLKQDYLKYEYIIIDGASQDGTLDILYSYNYPQMQVYSEPDGGISEAFNKGIERSSGEFLLFLNSGDFLVKNNVLSLVADDIEKQNAEIYTYAIHTYMNACWPKDLECGLALWNESLIPHQASFIHRKVFEKIGCFNPHFKVRMDYDFFCRCKKAKIKFFCRPEVITHYDITGISATNRFLHDKEGLAVQLLYKDDVGEKEKMQMESLLKEVILTGDGARREEMDRLRISASKNRVLVQVMDKWLRILFEGRSLSQYFIKRNIKTVAIYGWGYLGRNLKTELEKNNIRVLYCIDQNKKGSGIYSWEDEWMDVDCIVITPFYSYDEICNRIEKKGFYNCISFEELLNDASFL